MAEHLYLEAESENYHIIFCDPESASESGLFSDKAFLHLKSKKHRTILPYTKVRGAAQVPRDYINHFFETAKKLDGHSLDNHLSRFIPLRFMDIEILENYSHFAKKRSHFEEIKSSLCLMDVLNSYFGEPPSVKDWIRLGNWIKGMDITPRQEHAKKMALKVIDNEEQKSMFSNKTFLITATKTAYLELARNLDHLGLYDLNETPQELREILGRVFQSDSSLYPQDNIWTEVTAPHLGDDLPDDHPAREGLYRMAFGDNPHLSREEVMTSGVLEGSLGYGKSPDHWRDNIDGLREGELLRKRGNGSKLINFMLGKDPIEQRNAFQIMSRFNFDPGMLQSPSLSHKKLEDYRDTIMEGENPSKLLHTVMKEYLEKDVSPEYIFTKNKFGKKDFNILANNIVAQNRVVHAGKPGTFFTLEGESLTIEPYSRHEVREHAKEWNAGRIFADEKYIAKATLKDDSGEIVFSGPIKHSKLGQGMAMIIADMPKNLVTRPQHLLILEKLGDNDGFKKKLISGFMMHRDGGLKKASEYRGVWDSLVAGVDRALDGSEPYADAQKILERKKTLEKYSNSSYVKDGENIMHTIGAALSVHYLHESGLNIGSKFTDFEDLTDELEQGDFEFMLGESIFCVGEKFKDHRLISPLSTQYPSINQIISISDKLHKGYSSLIAEAGPNIVASWPPSLPEVSIPLSSGRVATLKVLDSYMDVRREGNAQNHCLASYSTRCLRREYEAFQVLLDGDHVATLGMECDGMGLSFDQLQGYGNSEVDPELEHAVKKFADKVESEGAYDGNEVSIESSDSQDLALTDTELMSLQLDIDIDNHFSIEKCRDFLVERLGGDATKTIILNGIQAAYDHYEEKYRQQYFVWEEYHSELMDEDPPERPIEFENIKMAKQAVERDFGSSPVMAMR